MAPKTKKVTVEVSSESSESSESPEPPKILETPQKEMKAANPRGVRKDGTLTETARIYMVLKFDSTKARALQAEHIRTLIRQSGCTGVKHEKAYDLMYTILFGDATTLLHFRQFQAMWEYRSLSPTAGGPRAEWWTAFRWFLRDCFSKAKTQIESLFNWFFSFFYFYTLIQLSPSHPLRLHSACNCSYCDPLVYDDLYLSL
jgi:hypothetical protein